MTISLPEPDDWDIKDTEEGKVAISPDSCLIVRGEGAKIFKRNGIKMPLSNGGVSGHVRVLVGELDGVRVYIRRRAFAATFEIILSKEDLYP